MHAYEEAPFRHLIQLRCIAGSGERRPNLGGLRCVSSDTTHWKIRRDVADIDIFNHRAHELSELREAFAEYSVLAIRDKT